jgi:hypothetical protein
MQQLAVFNKSKQTSYLRGWFRRNYPMFLVVVKRSSTSLLSTII